MLGQSQLRKAGHFPKSVNLQRDCLPPSFGFQIAMMHLFPVQQDGRMPLRIAEIG